MLHNSAYFCADPISFRQEHNENEKPLSEIIVLKKINEFWEFASDPLFYKKRPINLWGAF